MNHPKINLTLQVALKNKPKDLPKLAQFKKWIAATLTNNKIKIYPKSAEITIRILDTNESAFLNETYRKKHGATNILSFTYDPDPNIGMNETKLYGDLAICFPIVQKEALEQHKSTTEHLAHLTIHGILHLLGYDHIDDKEANIMEALEDEIDVYIKNS